MRHATSFGNGIRGMLPDINTISDTILAEVLFAEQWKGP